MKKGPQLLALAFGTLLHGAAFAQSGSLPPPHLPPPTRPASPPVVDALRSDALDRSARIALRLSLAGTALPVAAGLADGFVRGHTTRAAVILVGLGVIEGPRLGYDYAGLHRTAREQSALRESIALLSLLCEVVRPVALPRGGFLVAGAAVDAALAIHNVAVVPAAVRDGGYTWNLEAAPRRVGCSAGPAVALTLTF